jgi:hypothetical protein
MRLTPALMLALPAAYAWAAGSLQTDWVGGPGVPGPVTYWQQSFDSSSGISYAGTGGSIILTYSSILHWIHSTGPGGDEMCIVDTDGDGDLDIVSCQSSWDRISHWENLDGTGLNWARTIIVDSLPSGAVSLDKSDIDLDGDVDFVVTTSDGPYLIENTGGAWEKHQLGDLYGRVIRFCDIDGDGDEDFITAGYSSGRWWENLDGVGGSWLMHLVWQSGYTADCIRPCDFDGDGDVDVVLSRSAAPQVVWFENVDGVGGSWAAHTACSSIGGQYPTELLLSGLEVADMDQDGDEDIVVAGSNPLPEGRVIWVENLNGLGTSWQPHPVDLDLSGVYSVDAADLDGDGDADVMAYSGGSWGVRIVAWYENMDGEGTDWNGHVLDETTWEAQDIASCDMDADGDPDVVVCDGIAGVRWYGFSRATTGWLESSILDPPGESQLQWTDLSWEATVLPGTTLTFQVRASNDLADMGEWSPEISTPGSLSALLPEPAWYFQYRVNMATAAPPTTPMLDELLVQYDPVGIEGGPEPAELCLTITSGNPSPGTVTLDIYLPETCSTNLGIYDITGRLVSELLVGIAEAGHHQLAVSDLPTGCYSVLLRTPTESIRSMLVVLR